MDRWIKTVHERSSRTGEWYCTTLVYTDINNRILYVEHSTHGVCACVRVCLRVCVRVCVRVYVCACLFTVFVLTTIL